MRFLIAGLGSIGRRHLRNLLDLGEQDIVLYRTHQSSLPDEELADFPVETNLQAALEREPQAVIIANPTALHLTVALPAAQAGCHLLLEKPVSHNWDGVQLLQSIVRESGSRVLVGFQFRFHPGLRRLKCLLAEGAIGRPLSVRAHWGEYLPGWHPWEDYRRGYSAQSELGGGVILTLSHPLDYLRWLLGEVDSLWAFAGKSGELELDVEDIAEIGLHFTQGALGSLHLDYNQRPSAHHLEIIGSQGTLRWDQATGAVALYRMADTASGRDWEIFPVGAGFDGSQPFERNDLFLAEMDHFRAVASGEAEPACSLEDGLQALKLALAARQSAEQSRLIALEAPAEGTAGVRKCDDLI